MSPSDTVTVVVADDDDDVRAALRLLLDDADGIEVVAEVATAHAAVAACEAHAPDVAVLDVRMPGGGLAAARAITSSGSATAVMVLTAHDEPDVRRLAATHGAARFLAKSDGDDLVTAVLDAADRRPAPPRT